MLSSVKAATTMRTAVALSCDTLYAICIGEANRASPKSTRPALRSACMDAYAECLKKERKRATFRLVRAFERIDDAVVWVTQNPVLVGTVIVVGGILYVAVTGGSGAIVLVPLLV